MGLIFLCSSKLKLLFLSCSKIKSTSESANFQINSGTCWYLSGPGNVIPGFPWALLLFCRTQGVIHCFKTLFISPQRPPLIFVTAGFCFPFEGQLAKEAAFRRNKRIKDKSLCSLIWIELCQHDGKKLSISWHCFLQVSKISIT